MISGDDKLARARLSELLRELRGSSSQREFAKLLGTSYTAVQDWEKQIRFPKEHNLKRIAKLKGWTQEKLVRHLFLPDEQHETSAVDPLEAILAQIPNLSSVQMQVLHSHLNAQLVAIQSLKEVPMRRTLSDKQKHNLHLLLRASLKDQSPTEAVSKLQLDPGLFTDIFLRDDKNRVVDYEALERLSELCCRVVEWRGNSLPKVDSCQTYLGQTELLFIDLANGDKAIIE
jgi:transcriptional regulator with XRE-family HTH domain